MAEKSAINPNSDTGGASESAPLYICPNCGSVNTMFWTKVYSYPLYKLDRWLDPEAVVTVTIMYKCEDCGCLFEAEVKRLD